MARRLPLADINEYMVCSLCDGYLINATTIIECLHSFCRTCIVRYLEINKYCPVCEVQVHKTKPLCSIRPDQTLQDIVYKMVPGLYQNEMQRRREFYAEHPEAASGCTAEERGEGDPRFFFPDESISLTLNYRSKDIKMEENPSDPDVARDATTRYLKCPAAVTISHLKKFIVCKFSLPPAFTIDVFYADNILRDDFRLMDVAYIYAWRRAEPMEFSYSIKKRIMKVREPPISATTTTTVIPAAVEEPVEDKPEVAPEEKMEVVEEPSEPVTAVDPAEVSTTAEEKVEPEEEVSAPSSSTNDVQNMDVSESNVSAITSSPTEKPLAVAIAKPTYNSVKFVSAPANALLAPKNGICLKFIHDPELNPKSRSKKSGRKSGRSSRHKSVPKRFARLAPYPSPSVPVTCLPTQPIQHLSQITVGKLVPSVMSSLAPTIVTTLVSTTANSLYNTSQNSMPSSPFLNHPVSSSVASNTSNCVSEVPASTSKLVIPTSSSSAVPGPLQAVGLTASAASLHIRTDSSTTKDLTKNVVNSIATSKTTETLTTAAKDSISKDPSIPVPSKKSQNSDASDLLTTVLTISNCSSVAPLAVPVSSSVSTTVPILNSVSSSNDNKDDTRNNEIPIKEKESDTQNETVENSLSSRDSNGLVDVDNSKPTPPSSKEPNFEGAITEAPELFVQTVRNSISAEFSDNDDLGCQHDLVVDEQRMDDDEDNDVSLRKTINELAKKVDETDDIEADSGRGSDLSCPARGEDDRDSPAASDIRTSTPSTSSMNATTTTVTTSTSTDTSNPRYVKSNNINLVINNLYKHHEIGRTAASSTLSKSSNSDRPPSAKDDSGVLDLSTCTRKDSDAPKPRPKTVANPVLDIKHRQQTYLPAPNKQHTACPPAPKHPTSAMLHQSNSILHSHLTNPKPSHLQVPYNNLPFPIHTGRLVSSPSSLPDRSTPLYSHKMGSVSPQSMVGMIPPSILPYTSMMNNLASYAGRNNVNSSLPSRHSSSSSLQKDLPLPSPTAITSKSPYTYKPSSVTRKSLDSHLSSSPNSRGLSSPSAAPAHPRTSPSMMRMSPHHRSASPAPSPQQVTPTGNLVASSLAAATSASQFKPSVPIYKKSDSVSKNHSYKFKGSSNLAVINPDPNGYRQKIVIRNLDFRPNN